MLGIPQQGRGKVLGIVIDNKLDQLQANFDRIFNKVE